MSLSWILHEIENECGLCGHSYGYAFSKTITFRHSQVSGMQFKTIGLNRILLHLLVSVHKSLFRIGVHIPKLQWFMIYFKGLRKLKIELFHRKQQVLTFRS